MKAPHLLRVDAGPEGFAPLVAAARALGLRLGWLELGPRPEPLPVTLETAAAAGVLRAVAVGEGRAVAVKPLKGPPVLRDLLREHFQGCAAVLVRGEVEAPLLEIGDDGWTVTPSGSAARRYTADELAATLRRPRPWGPAAPDSGNPAP